MKKIPYLLLAIALLSTLHFHLATALAQGTTAFTYQGQLASGGLPANGSYDLAFTLYAVNEGGVAVAGPVTNSATTVSNGLFTTMIDFGPGVFNGSNYWLEVVVQTNGGSGFTTLAPRQPITPTPYAIQAAHAANAAVANVAASATVAASANSVSASNINGTISTMQLPATVVTNGASGVNMSGTFSGNGSNITGVNLLSVNSDGIIGWATNYGNFVVHSSPSVGNLPRSLVAADVNGDGKPDLISADFGLNMLTVLTNNGSGGFALASSPGVGSIDGLSSVAAADVNGDGKIDLICANQANSTLTVFINNGSSGFVSNASYTVGPSPACVTAADVNGDGFVDFICANLGNNTLTVFTNNGSGGFVSNATYTVGSSPDCVTAADVDGDGTIDLISANYNSGTLTVLTNNGSGGFAISSSPVVGPGPSSVVAADVDGDGFLDLICANSGNNTLTVLMNDGSGEFILRSSPVVGSQPFSVAAADVNGDGYVDLICANNGNNTLTVLTNTGGGVFAVSASPGVGDLPYSVVAADVNGDGYPDLISANFHSSTLTVLFNTAVFTPSLAGNFNGNGSGLTNLNASAITSGTLPLAQLPAAVLTNNQTGVTLSGTFNGNGGGLTSLNATNLTGTISTAQLPANLVTNHELAVTLNGAFTGDGSGLSGVTVSAGNISGVIPMVNLPSNLVQTNDTRVLGLNNSSNTFSGTFTGNGASLTNLNAASLNGTVADSLLSANIPRLNGTNVLTGTNRFAGVVIATNANNLFTGNGSGLTNLNAAAITSGTLAFAQLPAAVVTNSETGVTLSGTFSGNGAGLGGLNASAITSGTLPLAQLPAAVVTNNETGLTLGGAFTGNGGGLTNLNASQVSSGTVADARLSGNVALLSSNQTFTGQNTIKLVSDQPALRITDGTTNGNIVLETLTGGNSGFQSINFNGYYSTGELQYNASKARWRALVDQRGTADVFMIDSYWGGVGMPVLTLQTNGLISGNGGGLTNVTASQLTGSISANQVNGTFSVAQLPAAVVTNGASGVSISGNLSGNLSGTLSGTFSGNGGGLTNISMSAIGQPGLLNLVSTYLTTTLTVGNRPESMAVADINGDGKPDLIVANNYTYTISVLTNNGSGGLTLASTFTPGGGPLYVSTGDINGDGKPDLAVAAWLGSGGEVFVFTNNGSGAFGADGVYNLGSEPNPRSVTLADLNNNGKSAFFVGCAGDVLVFTNNGAGQFAQQTVLRNNQNTEQIVATDLNGDGKLDLVAVDRIDGIFAVFTNNGSGGFITAGNFSVGFGHSAWGVAIGDVNGDGNKDVVVANDSDITVMRGDGRGNFSITTNINISPADALSVTLADVNNDGKLDVIYADNAGGAVGVMTNDGSGNFVALSTTSVGPNPLFIVTADFNGDGKPDFVVSNSGTNTLTELIYLQEITSSTAVAFTNSNSVLGGSLNGTFNGTASGTFGGNGAGLTNVNASSLGGSAITTNSSGIVLGNTLNANFHPIYLKTVGDGNHGVGYATSTTNFNGLIPPDGPVLWGWGGGALGSMNTGAKLDLVWTPSGVGIGSTNPASELHVVSSSGDAEISIQSGDAGNHRWTMQSSGSGNPALTSSFQIIDRTVGASRMTIYTNGNVAIPGNVTNNGSAIFNSGATFNGSATFNATTKVGSNPVTVGAETLRIVRGEITGTGAIDFGSGFSVTKNGTGDFTISFSTAFNNIPAFTATLVGDGSRLLFPVNFISSASAIEVIFYNTSGTKTDPFGFDFIAIGP